MRIDASAFVVGGGDSRDRSAIHSSFYQEASSSPEQTWITRPFPISGRVRCQHRLVNVHRRQCSRIDERVPCVFHNRRLTDRRLPTNRTFSIAPPAFQRKRIKRWKSSPQLFYKLI